MLVDDALRALRRGAAAKVLYALLLAGCAIVAAFTPRTSGARPGTRAVEWPLHWDGRALRPLAPDAVEQRFAARFPGSLARLTDGERQFVMRDVAEPTRMLHPAADCYRASGWRIEAMQLERDVERRRWRCFDAVRGDRRLRVCERITDRDGAEFTDMSDWFWAALSGRSSGPWRAVVVVGGGEW